MKIEILSIIFSVNLLISIPVSSETWAISEGITVTPSENLDVTFQLVEDFGNGSKVVVGWSGEENDYLMEVYKGEAGVKSEPVRRGMADQIRSQYNLRKLKIERGEYGTFMTNSSLPIEYWVDVWSVNDEVEMQLYYLINTSKVSYLISVFPSDINKMDKIIESSTELLKTASTVN